MAIIRVNLLTKHVLIRDVWEYARFICFQTPLAGKNATAYNTRILAGLSIDGTHNGRSFDCGIPADKLRTFFMVRFATVAGAHDDAGPLSLFDYFFVHCCCVIHATGNFNLKRDFCSQSRSTNEI